jgi:hypothetical protein
MLPHFALLIAAAIPAAVALAQDRPREQIGEVLGKPVYRDQLPTGDSEALENGLHRIFAGPVAERYKAEHRRETVPTEQELDAATEYFRREHEAQIASEASKLRAELANVEARLNAPDTPADEREELRNRETLIEIQLKPPGRDFAEFVLSSWKFEHYLYVTYGGGRLLWQQAGTEAFDATYRWLNDQERAGAFRITDERLRKLFYAYWTTKDHGSFLFADKERIRSEFLEPGWAAPAASQPASRSTSAPARQRP